MTHGTFLPKNRSTLNASLDIGVLETPEQKSLLWKTDR